MRKTYKCSNIKFCMEDENQRRTWEYLQGITRRDGSYGKILSDAFVAVLDSKNEIRADKPEELLTLSLKQSEHEFEQFEEIFARVLEAKFRSLQVILTDYGCRHSETLGERLTSDAYASEVIRRYF